MNAAISGHVHICMCRKTYGWSDIFSRSSTRTNQQQLETLTITSHPLRHVTMPSGKPGSAFEFLLPPSLSRPLFQQTAIVASVLRLILPGKISHSSRDRRTGRTWPTKILTMRTWPGKRGRSITWVQVHLPLLLFLATFLGTIAAADGTDKITDLYSSIQHIIGEFHPNHVKYVTVSFLSSNEDSTTATNNNNGGDVLLGKRLLLSNRDRYVRLTTPENDARMARDEDDGSSPFPPPPPSDLTFVVGDCAEAVQHFLEPENAHLYYRYRYIVRFQDYTQQQQNVSFLRLHVVEMESEVNVNNFFCSLQGNEGGFDWLLSLSIRRKLGRVRAGEGRQAPPVLDLLQEQQRGTGIRHQGSRLLERNLRTKVLFFW